MRIAAKRLRYALEIVGEPLGKSGRAAESAAVALQETLGDIHDLDVVMDLIDDFGAGRGKDLASLRRTLRRRRREIHDRLVRQIDALFADELGSALVQACDALDR